MKANDTEIRIFLEGTKQFIVPLFQRTYSWKRTNIRRLWDDLAETSQSKESRHFFGSFVTMPLASSASNVSRYTIIDGQQRLATIFILLSALRNRINEIDLNSKKKEEINDLYLLNKYHPQERCKVVPTLADLDIFYSIVDDSGPVSDSDSLIARSYKFFQNKFAELHNIDDLLLIRDTLLQRFSVVDIRLEEEDNPYLIFESLNATGTPLTQADLVRNYFFMMIAQDKQHEVYQKIWLPMQENLKDYLEDFIRHYLAMDGDIPSFGNIYSEFKKRTEKLAKTEDDTIGLMKKLKKFSEYYRSLLYPEYEKAHALRAHFQEINRLEVSTSYPLLMRLYDAYASKKLSLQDLLECLKTIETYIVRRAVCGIPTNVLNRYFPVICRSLNLNETVNLLKETLRSASGAPRMPADNEFVQCLKERRLFGNKILRYLLESVEQYQNKEVVSFQKLQVEHIMPQTLSDDWKNELGSDWMVTHQKYMDTLGNLTLTGYNPEYSNKLFQEKRDMQKGFKDSGLQLNRELSRLNSWSKNEIQNRAKKLSKVALRIWAFG